MYHTVTCVLSDPARFSCMQHHINEIKNISVAAHSNKRSVMLPFDFVHTYYCCESIGQLLVNHMIINGDVKMFALRIMLWLSDLFQFSSPTVRAENVINARIRIIQNNNNNN